MFVHIQNMHKLTLMSTMQWDKLYKYKLIEVFVNEQRIRGQKHCFYLCLNGYFAVEFFRSVLNIIYSQT